MLRALVDEDVVLSFFFKQDDVHQRVDEREVVAGRMARWMSDSVTGRTPRVHGNELCPAFLGRRDAGVGQRMLRRRVGTDHEDGVGEADFLKAVGGRPDLNAVARPATVGCVRGARSDRYSENRSRRGSVWRQGSSLRWCSAPEASMANLSGPCVRSTARRCSAMAR